jgi:DNA invertase Pin-like site-specific DNA recombinase
MAERFVSYVRVSTQKQGQSGLGLEAQQRAVALYLKSVGGTLAGEFVEVESGKLNERPQLLAALKACRLTGAALLVAKLDRLSRNAAFLLSLRESRVRFVCCDNPSANELTVGILAVVAEDERRRISERTKAALQAAKARGVRLGNPRLGELPPQNPAQARTRLQELTRHYAADLAEVVEDIRAQGTMSLSGIARELNRRNIATRLGGKWYPSSVSNLLARVDAE